jgi:alkylated DNA repair dioxygenase AlkB
MNLLPKDGEVFYYPEFFSNEESDLFYQTLVKEISWKQEPIKIFGKSVMQPRLTAWVGDPSKGYSYSGITMEPLPWNKSLLDIKQRVDHISETTFTSALLNFYRDQNDSMGWHRDDEKELGVNPVIASVSFGAARVFQLKHRQEKSLKVSLELERGSLLLMRGSTQHHWLHSIPKRTCQVSPRINITFRVLL